MRKLWGMRNTVRTPEVGAEALLASGMDATVEMTENSGSGYRHPNRLPSWHRFIDAKLTKTSIYGSHTSIARPSESACARGTRVEQRRSPRGAVEGPAQAACRARLRAGVRSGPDRRARRLHRNHSGAISPAAGSSPECTGGRARR
jgi:hypothetical protein